MDSHAIVRGGVACQCPPSAPNVEKAIAGLQSKLAANHFELGVLRGRKIVRPLLEIGAGIDQFRIEEERIERVGDVVVILNERCVLLGVSAARPVARQVLGGQGVPRGTNTNFAMVARSSDLSSERRNSRVRTLGRMCAEVKDRSVTDVDAAAHPQAEQCREFRPAQQGRNDPLVGDHDREQLAGQVRGSGGAIPEHEPDVKAKPLARMREKFLYRGRSFFCRVHSCYQASKLIPTSSSADVRLFQFLLRCRGGR